MSTSADRQRDYRARQRSGKRVYCIALDEVALVAKLLEAAPELLDETDADDPECVAAALQKTVEGWIGTEPDDRD
jgi:hypothetical protein